MQQMFLPLIGGLLIGLASTILLGFVGRIAGISGIVSTSLAPIKPDNFWRFAFIAGLIAGGVVFLVVAPEFFNYPLAFTHIEAILAGLLVGVGTRIGSGCTSGHGVCGLARLSVRSLVATLLFMVTAIITVYVRS